MRRPQGATLQIKSTAWNGCGNKIIVILPTTLRGEVPYERQPTVESRSQEAAGETNPRSFGLPDAGRCETGSPKAPQADRTTMAVSVALRKPPSNRPNLHGAHRPLKVNHVPAVVKVFWCGARPSLGRPGRHRDSSVVDVPMSSSSDRVAPWPRFSPTDLLRRREPHRLVHTLLRRKSS